MLTVQQLNLAKKDLLSRSGGGVSLPVAGAMYWTILGITGFFLSTSLWILVAFVGSGLLFPLGLLLSKPFDSNLLITDHPLNSVAIRAVIAINLLWPVHIAAFFIAPQLVPLSLSIGMGLHWPVIGWMYGSRTCMAHAIARTCVASAIWFIFPELRFTVLPLSVALVYGTSVVFLRREVKTANSNILKTNSS